MHDSSSSRYTRHPTERPDDWDRSNYISTDGRLATSARRAGSSAVLNSDFDSEGPRKSAEAWHSAAFGARCARINAPEHTAPQRADREWMGTVSDGVLDRKYTEHVADYPKKIIAVLGAC